MENWKTINGFSNYEISDLGRVRTRRRKGTQGGILSQKVRDDNRHKVHMIDDNKKQKDVYVHRLVATHFLPNYYNKPQIDHINRDPTDNRVYNLRWCSQRENLLNIGLRKDNKTGKKGVNYDKARNAWVARIKLENTELRRRFKSFEDACKWRDEHVKIYYDDKYYTE